MSVLSHLIGPDALVRKALDRVRNSTLVEDKRAALEDLAKISKTEPVAACASFPVVVPLLSSERGDAEMLRSVLEIIEGCLTPSPSVTIPSSHADSPISRFAKEQQYISIILDLLEERDWTIRYGVLKTLKILVTDRLAALQQAVLSSPQGLAHLMDVLNDNREIIRNEVLLVMVAVTKGNAEVQKILAFEGAFDTLFGIVKEEEEGSIIAIDCLSIVNNLLRGNPSNATFFREMAGVSAHLLPLLERPITHGPGWEQRWLWLMEVLGNLLSPAEALQSAQTALGKQGVLAAVAETCISKVISKAAKVSSLRMLGILVYKHTPNRIALSTLVAKSDGLPLLHHLLMICLKERSQGDDTTHEVNSAAAFLWKCYLSGNVDGQQHLAATLMPHPIFDDDFGGGGDGGAAPLPIGKILSSSLMAANEACAKQIAEGNLEANARLTEVWSAAAIFSFILENNSVCQEIAATTPMELPMSDKPVEYLLKCILRMITRGGKSSSQMDHRAITALLRLLCVWSFNCSIAAENIFSEPSMISYLLNLLGTPGPDAGASLVPANASIHLRGASAFLLASLQYIKNEEQLKGVYNIIESRIGIETVQEQMDLVVRSEAFLAAKRRDIALPPPKTTPDDTAWGFLIYDSDSAVMLTKLIEGFSKCIFKLMGCSSPSGRISDASSAILRERDALKEEVERLRAQLSLSAGDAGNGMTTAASAAVESEISQAQRRCEELEETVRDVQANCQKLSKDCEGLAQSNRILEEQLSMKDERIAELEVRAAAAMAGGDAAAAAATGEKAMAAAAGAAAEAAEAQIRALKEKLQAHEAKDKAAAGELRNMGKEMEELKEQNKSLKSQLEAARQSEAQATSTLKSTQAELAAARQAASAAAGGGDAAKAAVAAVEERCQARIAEMQVAVEAAGRERDAARGELEELKKKFQALNDEHEDLLVMLAEQQGDEEGGGEDAEGS